MKFREVAEQSVIVTALQTVLAGSRIFTAVRSPAMVLLARIQIARTWFGTSRTGAVFGQIASKLTITSRASATRSLADPFARWVRASYLYRWLTAEPDPEVIVIDLRETYAVGPFLTLLDRLVGPLSRLYQHSTLQRLASGIERAVNAFANTRLGKALSRVLAPPEPPDRATASEADHLQRSPSGDDSDERQ
jgi:hypothetical protein